jgi:hypothetical protein
MLPCETVQYRAVESESEGIFRWSRSRSRKEFLGGVGVVKIYRLRTQSKILTRYSKSRALIATVTIRLILKYRLQVKNVA